VDLLYQLEQESYFFLAILLPEWLVLTVSSPFRLLVFRSEVRPWRLLSHGLSSPESSVVCGGLVSYGCRRFSLPSIVPIVRSRGSRSAFLEIFAQGWQIRSLASFTGFVFLVKIENWGLFFVPTRSSFLHSRIRVWVCFKTYDFVCCSVCVQARSSKLSSFEHPRGYLSKDICRFFSVIISVVDVVIQSSGIGTGLALCFLQ